MRLLLARLQAWTASYQTGTVSLANWAQSRIQLFHWLFLLANMTPATLGTLPNAHRTTVNSPNSKFLEQWTKTSRLPMLQLLESNENKYRNMQLNFAKYLKIRTQVGLIENISVVPGTEIEH